MKDQEKLDQISRKLSALISLLLVKDRQKLTTADNVKMFVRCGISNQEIADVLGTSRGTVEVLKSRALKIKKENKIIKKGGNYEKSK